MGRGRPAPYDQVLEDSLLDYEAWKRRQTVWPPTGDEAIKIVLAIEERRPELTLVVQTNRALRCLATSHDGVESEALLRMVKEARRAQ